MDREQRLREAGYELPEPVAPVAAYVPAVRSGDLVFVSGQVPFRDGALVHPGTVGDDVTVEQAQEAARVCCLNGLAALKAAVGSLAAVRRVVRVGVFVTSAAGFTAQPLVANGASELLETVFGEAGRHARAAVGVAALPLGASVEVEFVFEVSG